MYRSFWSGLLAVALLAQTASAQDPLKIVIKEGEGVLNDLKRGRGTEIAVEVRDGGNQPVSGAEVTFVAPSIGAAVVFADGSNTFKSVTDASGIARTSGLKPNRTEGRFNIKVTVVAGSKKGSAVVPQVNTLAGGSIVQQSGSGGGSKTKLILGLVSAGASVGILATRLGGGGNNTPAAPPRPPTTLTIGGVTVGGPR